MKQILLLIFFFFFSALPASAQTDWNITDFQTNTDIQKDGTVAVTENISVDFHSLEKHGIYRDLPIAYEDATGKKTYTKIEDITVEQDGQKAKYKVSDNENNLNIRIGDADKTISGQHTYTLTYRATGVLRSFSTYDELYWNVTGNDWEVPIGKASSTVTVPKDKIEKIMCFEGVRGATTPCVITNQTKIAELFASLSFFMIFTAVVVETARLKKEFKKKDSSNNLAD